MYWSNFLRAESVEPGSLSLSHAPRNLRRRPRTRTTVTAKLDRRLRRGESGEYMLGRQSLYIEVLM